MALLFLFQSETPLQSQDVLGWGYLAWQSDEGSGAGVGPRCLESVCELGGVQQIACSEKSMLILTKTGKVYSLAYSSEFKVRGVCLVRLSSVRGVVFDFSCRQFQAMKQNKNL